MSEQQSYIGVFDSGVGGLSVLSSLITAFPNESFLYLGDTARLPYGTKSKETIKNYVTRNINFMTSNFSIKAVVVACNSASSVLSEMNLPIKTIGVIEAGADAALSKTKTNHIGVWATKATVSSKAYEKEILNMEPESKVTSVSCSTLVTLVEEAGDKHPLLEPAFEYYLAPIFKSTEADILILGCTHFPFFKEQLQKHLDKLDSKISLADAASDEIATQLKELLGSNLSSKKELLDRVMVTDDAPHFKNFLTENMPKDWSFELEKVQI